MSFSRASGILLHPTSLPGPFGVGDLGNEAYHFADFLLASGQSLWQVLPLGPTSHGASPYSCTSAFAGNALLISPDKLVQVGLLSERELSAAPSFPETRVDFDTARKFKAALLNSAFQRFSRVTDSALHHSFKAFCQRQTSWLDDYALFQALKTAHDGLAWSDWDPPLRRREPTALNRAQEELRNEVESQKFYQFLFFGQWSDLKGYCGAHGIKLIGDIPIFVAYDSADVWCNPELFKLDGEGAPTVVAGVPPDYFSATGQFWGNPIYNWDAMKADGFRWWIARLRKQLELFDMLRIDHFRGFVACWEIPAGDRTAERGQWVSSPGGELFAAAKRALGKLPIIAEDLGVITPDVDELRDVLGFPGMRVLQFGFSSDSENIHLPGNYPKETVAYTATHDNNTTVGWFSETNENSLRTAEEIEREKKFCLEYLQSSGGEINWDFIDAVLGAAADTAIIPLQDVLGLGNAARMNLPNTIAGNWAWRFNKSDLTEKHVARLRELTERHGRAH